MLVVQLADDATLLVNGIETRLTGDVRHFFTTGLAGDKRYSYELTVRGAGGVEQTKTVWLEAGQQQIVSFDGGPAPTGGPPATAVATAPAGAAREAATEARDEAANESPNEVTTSLTLRVPEDARVWIAGRPTARTGVVRHFSTRSLAAGQVWEDYEVRVVTSVDGHEEEVVRKLTLTAGRTLELAIDPTDRRSARADATASLR